MRWLVQEHLNSQRNYLDLIDVLYELRIEYLIVRLNKDYSMSVVDKESGLILDDSEALLKAFLTDSDIMVYGSKALADIAKSLGLYPGSFMTNNFEFEVLGVKYRGHLLNDSFIVGDLFSLNPSWDTFFIRPTGNTKLFTGMVVTLNEFKTWQQRESNDNSPYHGQSLMISPTKCIDAEYRLFVVNGVIVTGSSYKVNGSANTSLTPDKDVINFAEKMLSIFQPATAFVMDVALTSEGYKIVEFNNINSSGFYNSDIAKVVKAINTLLFRG